MAYIAPTTRINGELITAAIWNTDLTDNITAIHDIVSVGASTELTISSGAITVTAGNHTVDTEGDAASDNLDTINGGTANNFVLLRAENTARTVVIKHGTGNVYLNGAADFDLSGNMTLLLFYDGTNWSDVGAGGSGTAIDVYEDGVSTVTSIDKLDFKDFNIEDLGSNDAGIWHNIPHINDGRLTLTTGTPITTSDVTAATTVYYTPYIGEQVSLHDGTRWRIYEFAETSVSVPSTTVTPFDIFLYDDAGTLKLETTDWTNDTTRATALTTLDGVLVKTGATTRRYLGTGRTTSSSGETEDSVSYRFLYNYYNRIIRRVYKNSGPSHTYTTASWRYWNGDSTNHVDFITGVVEDDIFMCINGNIDPSADGVQGIIAVGLNIVSGAAQPVVANKNSESIAISAVGMRTPQLGLNQLNALEYGATTVTFDYFTLDGSCKA